MDKKLIIAISITSVILLLVGLSIFFTIGKEAYIKAKIVKANYCDVDSDCVDAGGKCPFGCWVYVNKNEVSEISNLIDNYNSKCVYGCLRCPSAVCNNKKCEAVCE